MTFRTRIFITVVALCHLFLMPGLLISQLQADAGVRSAIESNPSAEANLTAGKTQPSGEEVTIRALEQEKKGDIYTLRGEAEIDFRTYVLRADEMTYDSKSGQVALAGHIILNGGPHDEYVTASHGTYNVNTDSGKFYDVVGSTGAKLHGRNVVLTSSTPFSFVGREVEKVGRDKFIVRHGRVTSCALPNPKWTFNAGEVQVVAGENARIYNTTFRLFGVPVFYFPFVQHPVERIARQSGFLLPHIGNSTVKGLTIGDAFYWAMNRSMDMTLGAEYYSRRGWAQRGDFRWRPSETAFLTATYFGVVDRGTPITQTIFVPGVGTTTPTNTNIITNPGGEEARIVGEALLPHGFRGVANFDYLSQFIFRAIYAERFSEAINTEVKSVGFLSRTEKGYSLNTMISRYQNFQSTQPGDVITIVHAPSGEFSSTDRRLGGSPFYWSFDTAAEGLSRRQPAFTTNEVVGRFDITPSISMPLRWRGWSFRPELTLRDTYYSQRVLQNSSVTGTNLPVPVNDPINRRAMETVVEIRPPVLAKVFDGTVLNHKIKHTIEPHFRYENVSGVNNFRDIIRFDDRDILANTNGIEYGVVNRLFAKTTAKVACATEPVTEENDELRGPEGTLVTKARASEDSGTRAKKGCEAPYAREIVSWEVAQKYFFDPTFGGALIPGQRNVFTATENLTGIAFLFERRRFSPIISRLRINKSATTDLDWQIDYDTLRNRINSSMALVSFKLPMNLGISAGHAFLQTPNETGVSHVATPPRFNQLRTQLTYGSLNRRGINTAALVGYDTVRGTLQYAAVQTTYNWDCCGFTVEYRRFKFGNIRDESQYRFALTLTNIATFGTLRKQERLF